MFKLHLPKFSGEKKVRSWIALLVIVLVSAALLRFVEWVKPDTGLPLLTDAQGIVQLTDLSQIGIYVDTNVTTPTELFGSQLQVIGIYPITNDAFPEKTVALVYVRQWNRFVEIDFRPNTTIEKELSHFVNQKNDTVVLTNGKSATLIQLRDQSFCKSPHGDGIGMCQFTRLLAFERDKTVITIFADGRHATDGELIQMAKSIVDAEPSE